MRSIGRVAVKLERACERAMNVLLELIETKVNYVVQEPGKSTRGRRRERDAHAFSSTVHPFSIGFPWCCMVFKCV